MASALKEKAKSLFVRRRVAQFGTPNKESGISDLYDLSSLEEGSEMSGKKSKKSRLAQQSKDLLYEIVGSIPRQLIDKQVLLRPLALVTIPFLWIFYRLSTNAEWIFGFDSFSLQTALSLLAILSISSMLLLCTWLAVNYFLFKPKTESLQKFRSKLRYDWRRLSIEIFRQILSLLAEEGLNRYAEKFSSLLQTIGYQQMAGNRKRYTYGVQSFSNGDVYEGEMFEEKSCGKGVYTFHLSGKYEGEWEDGEFDGHGVETWDAGNTYEGQYKRGLKHGFGVYKFQNGDEYCGQWIEGHSNGYGVQKSGDGSTYIGSFKNGAKHGLGYHHFSNGDTYAGEYCEDKLHGYGVYKFTEGPLYEGAWYDGKKHGFGTYNVKDDESHAGIWEYDIFKLPSNGDSSLDTSSAVSHTRLLNVVQEARQAASKALELPRVRDEVNRAIFSAKEAAKGAKFAAIKASKKKQNINTLDFNV